MEMIGISMLSLDTGSVLLNRNHILLILTRHNAQKNQVK